MKISKIVFLLLLFPALLYSQYLEQGDINIFIQNQSEIWDLLEDRLNSSNSGDWTDYTNELKVILKNYRFYSGFTDFSGNFRVFLSIATPNELETIFNNIGWKNNGQKKFWVIFFGFSLVHEKRNYEYDYDEKELFPERYVLILDI